MVSYEFLFQYLFLNALCKSRLCFQYEIQEIEIFNGLPELEAATGGVLLRQVLFKFSQNLQENTCASVSFLRVQLY